MSGALSQRFAAAVAAIRTGWRTPAAAGLLGPVALAVVMLAARETGALQWLELAAYDRMVAWRGGGAGGPSRIVTIAADEGDITRFGWPLPDGVLADIIARLREARPRAIGIDIFRPTPIAPGTDRLDAVLAGVPELVWADRFGATISEMLPPPRGAARRAGFADVVLDPSGIVRRQILVLGEGRRVEASLALRLALLHLRAEGIGAGIDAQGSYRLGGTVLPRLDGTVGGYRDIDTSGYQVLLEYRAPRDIPRYSVAELIDGHVPPVALSDRTVLVGMISDSVKDAVIAPVGTGAPVSLAGVALQGLSAAQLIAHGLDGLAPTRALPRAAETAILLAVILGGALVGTCVASPTAVFALAVGGAGLLLAVALWAFLHAVWLPAALLPLGWLSSVGVSKAAMAQAEATQRAFLMRLFSTHISAPVAREMWRRRADFVRFGRPLPVRLDATVLFSDVNDFTTLSEAMEPEEIVRWLEPYMIAMTDLIDAHGGCVERFSGDGILAMFGVPMKRASQAEIAADAMAAVACARAMGDAIERLNAGYRDRAEPEIRFAVGIQSGVLVGCSLGSRDRQQYTTMGDTTNTAARLVNVAKDLMKQAGPGPGPASCTVIGAATAAFLDDCVTLRPLGLIELKGKARRTECFALADAGADFASGRKYG